MSNKRMPHGTARRHRIVNAPSEGIALWSIGQMFGSVGDRFWDANYPRDPSAEHERVDAKLPRRRENVA